MKRMRIWSATNAATAAARTDTRTEGLSEMNDAGHAEATSNPSATDNLKNRSSVANLTPK